MAEVDIVNDIPAASRMARREFFVTSIVGAGLYAAAVSPIAGQTVIHTDDKGLITGAVDIPVSDGQIPAYRAMPDRKGKKFPVVLVIHEIFGVHEWIQDVCRRFAKEGYMAIAPALYARQGDVHHLPDPPTLQRDIFFKIPDDQVNSDLDSTLAWAAKNHGDVKKAAITGFCWGGRAVWMYSAHNPKLKAGAAWYGTVAASANSPANPVRPTNPIDHVKELKVPIIGFYGGLDTGISQESLNRMKDALAAQKSKSEINVYPDAKHGFFADYRESYNQKAAQDAWPKLLAWFKKYGAKP